MEVKYCMAMGLSEKVSWENILFSWNSVVENSENHQKENIKQIYRLCQSQLEELGMEGGRDLRWWILPPPRDARRHLVIQCISRYADLCWSLVVGIGRFLAMSSLLLDDLLTALIKEYAHHQTVVTRKTRRLLKKISLKQQSILKCSYTYFSEALAPSLRSSSWALSLPWDAYPNLCIFPVDLPSSHQSL